MKAIVILLVCLCSIRSTGQGIQVKADSVIARHGTWAILRGSEMKTDTAVLFIYKWKGAGRPQLINQWYTIYWPVPKRHKRRSIYVQKND